MMKGHKAQPATTLRGRLSQRDSAPVELATGALAIVLLFVSAAWLLLAVAGIAAALALACSWLRLRTLRAAAANDLASLEKSEARLAGIIRSSMEAILSVDERQ
ncbi:histidine kinase, partial [Ralstonia solanacearum]